MPDDHYANSLSNEVGNEDQYVAVARKSGRKRRVLRVVYRLLTGLVGLGFLLCLGYYLYTPLKQEIFQIRLQMTGYDPHGLAYNIFVQSWLRLCPPREYVAVGDGGVVDSIESVDGEVQLAGLEGKNAKLQISSIGVLGNIVDGVAQDSMLRGFWHYPVSSTPGKRGNTVIIGHRFDKLPPDPQTFFNLDQVKIGDKVVVSMSDKSINYTVIQTKIVDKNDKSVLEDSGDYRLTLITCTPLWTADKRLVVIAIQDEVANVT